MPPAIYSEPGERIKSMIKHTALSLLRDLKAFIGIKKERLDAIDAAPDTAVESSFGVNMLADAMHPDRISLEVKEVKKDRFGSFLVLISGERRTLPSAKPGQFIVIKPSVTGIKYSRAVYIAFAERTSYTVFIPQTDDSEAEKLVNARKGDIFEATSPAGLGFYQPLRDSGNIFVCCDKEGFGASEAFRNDKELQERVKVYTHLAGAVDTENGNSQLSVFLRECKLIDGTLFIFGSEDFVTLIKKTAEDCGLIKKRIRYDIISPGKIFPDEEKKYVCRVKRGSEEFDVLCYGHMPLSASLEYAGVECNINCMSGTCGYCRMKLVSGDISVHFPEGEEPVRMADAKHGFIHPCRSYPLSDLTVII